ncbi:MAG: hypothetical protein J6B96_00980, partial [Agathobacter sp.]|nr:hypothetical protein [Agathobacter sp.]
MDSNNYYNNYNPYTNPNSQEERRNTTEHMEGGQPPRKKASLGTKIIRTIAIALVFGLVAGGVGLGIIYVGGSSLGIFQEASGTPGEDGNKNPNSELENDKNS